MEKIIIDRFEGDIVVCEREDCTIINIQRNKLPKGVRVGNILRIDDNGNIKIDVQEELRRKEQILRMQQQIFGD